MMVLPYAEQSLLLILQIDHSRVAGQLAAHWGNAEFAGLDPYSSMVLGAQEHDSGWWEWEIRPTLGPDGRPLDYQGGGKVLGQTWLDFYSHGIQRVAEQDPYAGYMVSMHGAGLVNRGFGLRPTMPDRTSDPGVPKFLGQQQSLRDHLKLSLQAEMGELASDDALWLNFKYMEVFDQMAQFICNRYPFNSTARSNGPTPTLSDVPVPVRSRTSDITLTIDVRDETRAVLRPYPFDIDPLVIAFPGRVISNRVYDNQAEFLREYYKARPVTITYSLHTALPD